MVKGTPEDESSVANEAALNPTEQLLLDVKSYLETNQSEIQPYSAQDYFSKLILRAVETRKKGNYGIAASLVVRFEGQEFIIYGQNSMRNPSHPHGHAEMDAIQTAWQIHTAIGMPDGLGKAFIDQLLVQGKLEVRPAPHQHAEEILFTTLEPCPMCAVGGVINPHVQKVVMASEDISAGALSTERLANLAPLWGDQARAHGLEVLLAQTEDQHKHESYVSPELQEMLLKVFFDTREELDKELEMGALFNVQSLGANLVRFFAEATTVSITPTNGH